MGETFWRIMAYLAKFLVKLRFCIRKIIVSRGRKLSRSAFGPIQTNLANYKSFSFTIFGRCKGLSGKHSVPKVQFLSQFLAEVVSSWNIFDFCSDIFCRCTLYKGKNGIFWFLERVRKLSGHEWQRRHKIS